MTAPRRSDSHRHSHDDRSIEVDLGNISSLRTSDLCHLDLMIQCWRQLSRDGRREFFHFLRLHLPESDLDLVERTIRRTLYCRKIGMNYPNGKPGHKPNV